MQRIFQQPAPHGAADSASYHPSLSHTTPLQPPAHGVPIVVPLTWRSELISLLWYCLENRCSPESIALPPWLYVLPPKDPFTHTFQSLLSAIATSIEEHRVRTEALLMTQHQWAIEKEESRLGSLRRMYEWMEQETERREREERRVVQESQLTKEEQIAAAARSSVPYGLTAANLESTLVASSSEEHSSGSSYDSSDSLDLDSSESEESDTGRRRRKKQLLAKAATSAGESTKAATAASEEDKKVAAALERARALEASKSASTAGSLNAVETAKAVEPAADKVEEAITLAPAKVEEEKTTAPVSETAKQTLTAGTITPSSHDSEDSPAPAKSIFVPSPRPIATNDIFSVAQPLPPPTPKTEKTDAAAASEPTPAVTVVTSPAMSAVSSPSFTPADAASGVPRKKKTKLVKKTKPSGSPAASPPGPTANTPSTPATTAQKKAAQKKFRTPKPPQRSPAAIKKEKLVHRDSEQRQNDLQYVVDQEVERSAPEEQENRQKMLKKILEQQKTPLRLATSLLSELVHKSKELKLKPSGDLQELLYRQLDKEDEDWLPATSSSSSADSDSDVEIALPERSPVPPMMQPKEEVSEYEEVTDSDAEEEAHMRAVLDSPISSQFGGAAASNVNPLASPPITPALVGAGVQITPISSTASSPVAKNLSSSLASPTPVNNADGKQASSARPNNISVVEEEKESEISQMATPSNSKAVASGNAAAASPTSVALESKLQLEPSSPTPVPSTESSSSSTTAATRNMTAEKSARLAAYRERLKIEGPPVPFNKRRPDPDVVEKDDHIAYWSRSPQLAARKSALDDFWTLYSNKPILVKHGKTGFGHKTTMRVDNAVVEWNYNKVNGPATPSSKKKSHTAADDEKYLRWSDILSIQGGLSTPILKRLNKSKANFCFSLIARHRTLDLQASTREERDIWMEGLRLHLADLKTRRCKWSSRIVNGVDSNPEILTPLPVEESELPTGSDNFGGFFGGAEYKKS